MNSKKYRAMIYVAVATLFFYSKDIKNIKKGMTVNDFRADYPLILERVFEEIINLFNYKLSEIQISKAIGAYMNAIINPQSIHDTTAAVLYIPTLTEESHNE